jgi:SAM-dependent methyltransferase
MIDGEADGTSRFYACNAELYVGRGGGAPNPLLPPFLARLRTGSRILELGCGAGRDASAMIAAGHDVVPTDGIPEIAREAERLLQRPVRVLRFEDLNDYEVFDAVWANASLLHVARARLPNVLARVRRALKPGGLHFATYKSGGGEGFDGHGRYCNFPDIAELWAAYGVPDQWEVVSVEEFIEPGFDLDRPEPWIAITLQRPANGCP